MEGILLNQTGKYATKEYVQQITKETIDNQNIPICLPIRTFLYTRLDEGAFLPLSTEQQQAGRITPYSHVSYASTEKAFDVSPLTIECIKSGLYNCCIDIESRAYRLPGYGTLSISIDNFYTFPDMGPSHFSNWTFPGDTYTQTSTTEGKNLWFKINNSNFAGNYSGIQFVKYFNKGEKISFKFKAGSITVDNTTFTWRDNQMHSGSYSGSKSHNFYIDLAVYAFCCSKDGLKAEGKKDCFQVV